MKVQNCESCLMNTYWCALTLQDEPGIIAQYDANLEGIQMGELVHEAGKNDWDTTIAGLNDLVESKPVIDADDLIERVESQLIVDTADTAVSGRFDKVQDDLIKVNSETIQGRARAVERLIIAKKLQSHILAGCGIERPGVAATLLQKLRGKTVLRNCGATNAPGLTEREVSIVKDIEDGYERQLIERSKQ